MVGWVARGGVTGGEVEIWISQRGAFRRQPARIAAVAGRGSSVAEQRTHKPLVVSSNLTPATSPVPSGLSGCSHLTPSGAHHLVSCQRNRTLAKCVCRIGALR